MRILISTKQQDDSDRPTTFSMSQRVEGKQTHDRSIIQLSRLGTGEKTPIAVKAGTKTKHQLEIGTRVFHQYQTDGSGHFGTVIGFHSGDPQGVKHPDWRRIRYDDGHILQAKITTAFPDGTPAVRPATDCVDIGMSDSSGSHTDQCKVGRTHDPSASAEAAAKKRKRNNTSKSEVGVLSTTTNEHNKTTAADNNEYEVESIVARRIRRCRSTPSEVQYRIKWRNYDFAESTWEPAQHLSSAAMQLVAEFEEKQKVGAHVEVQMDDGGVYYGTVVGFIRNDPTGNKFPEWRRVRLRANSKLVHVRVDRLQLHQRHDAVEMEPTEVRINVITLFNVHVH